MESRKIKHTDLRNVCDLFRNNLIILPSGLLDNLTLPWRVLVQTARESYPEMLIYCGILPLEQRTKLALTAMRKILRTTERNSKALLHTTGLTPSQLILMHVLEEGGEQTAGEVAARMGITQATTTVLIQKLESLGMVGRRKGDADRRQSWLSLSSKGANILTITPDGAHSQFHREFSALQDWEQMMIIAALERVAAMLGDTEKNAAPIIDSVHNLSADI
ncbi:MAG: MarR family winged helix-turn-helix transcriptional regulator [Cypionkella sp.]